MTYGRNSGEETERTVELRRPSTRACERCGRAEEWDEAATTWRVEETGRLFCVHEWDINGSFLPFELVGEEAEPAE